MVNLADLLVASAARFPDRPCLIERGGRSVTYADVDRLSADVGAHLDALGVKPGDRVGVAAPKSIETIVAVLGILRAGAAYVPVDPAAPPKRSAGIFADCQVRHIFAAPGIAPELFREVSSVHPVAPAGSAASFEIASATGPCDEGAPGTAYILYTSGSTGKPKGVVHSHDSARAFIDWCSAAFSPRETDCFSSHAPIHFDLSILDLYVSMKHGAAIRLIDANEARQPKALTQLLVEDSVTVWYSTPTILRLMVDEGGLGETDLSRLRVICFAGEVYPAKHLEALIRIIGNVRLFNLYGPTETNVCTYYEVEGAAAVADGQPVPIGYPASGDSCAVVDETSRPVGRGERGELVVSGPSVMKGYWALPERNAACFLQMDGTNWYRTGDIVRAREDGALLYLGRRDRMVKRRGYRIELGEIESAMLRHEQVEQVAAVATSDGDGEVRIVAFLEWRGEEGPSLIALKRFASANLPTYMIPDRFQALDHLPQTSTDKIDYQNLKEAAGGLFSQ